MTCSHFDSSLYIFSPFRQFHTTNLVLRFRLLWRYIRIKYIKTLTIFYKFKNIRSIDRSIYIIHNNKNGSKGQKGSNMVKKGQKGQKGQKGSNMVKKGQKGQKGPSGSKRSIRVHPGSTPDSGPGQNSGSTPGQNSGSIPGSTPGPPESKGQIFDSYKKIKILSLKSFL